MIVFGEGDDVTRAARGIFLPAIGLYVLAALCLLLIDHQLSVKIAALVLASAALVLALWWGIRADGSAVAAPDAHQHMRAALDDMPQALGLFDAEGNLSLSNREFAKLLNLTPGIHAPAIPFAELEKRLADDINMLGMLHRTRERIQAGQVDYAYETHEDGRVLSITHQGSETGGVVVTLHDITNRRFANLRVGFIAAHDMLTGLLNRRAFRDKIDAIVSDDAANWTEVAVLFIDLNGFKTINEEQGHLAGDTLLCASAGRIKTALPDDCVAARIAPDVFGVLQTGADQPRAITALAQTLIERIAAPVELEDKVVRMTASCGIAHAATGSADVDELFKMAELALNHAKAEGRGTLRIFETQMATSADKRRQMEGAIRDAIAMDLFELYYQPFMNIRHGGVAGCEALLRLRHPTLGMISPLDFIPVAEDIGAIGEIGALVLRRACQAAVAWPLDVKVSVNVSPLQFAGRDFLLDVTEALAISGLPANRLDLEITESALLADSEQTLTLLHKLHSLGVRISMDDFGTGYSSFNYLRRFPFDRIKIDKSFVRDVASHEDAIAIVRAATSIAASLGMIVTAEGIETQEQLDRVRAGGCIEAQGYFFCPPVRAETLPRVLRELARDTRAVA